MSTLLKLIPGSLPENFTPESWQDLYNRQFELGRAYWPDDMTIVNYGSTKPSGSNVAYPWIRTVAPGRLDRVYNYYNGQWISPHPIPPGSDFVALWKGSLANLVSFDGGDANPVTLTSGPFWEQYTAANAKMPVGPGTLPGGTVVAVGDTGGEETHILSLAELPAMTFESGYIVRWVGSGGGNNLPGGSQFGYTPVPYTFGSGLAHNNMPPYLGIYFIQRTARAYYLVP